MASTVVSIIDPILITDYDEQLLSYDVKKFSGYQAQAVDGARTTQYAAGAVLMCARRQDYT